MLHIPTFLVTQVLLISAAVAQATTAPGTAAPGAAAPAAESGFNPLWLLLIVALVAAAALVFYAPALDERDSDHGSHPFRETDRNTGLRSRQALALLSSTQR
jgi:hypothetical protein